MRKSRFFYENTKIKLDKRKKIIKKKYQEIEKEYNEMSKNDIKLPNYIPKNRQFELYNRIGN